MVEMIMVKIAPLGKTVTEVLIPTGSTVKAALIASGNTAGSFEDLRKNGKPTSQSDIVSAGEVITIVPAIRGGIN
jgi:sulfur carrier protein ThiS